VRRLTTLRALSVLLAAAAPAACANVRQPPGGPDDPLPPRLVAVSPDTGATGVTPRHVVFRFDEVVSERPSGSSTRGLEDLFLVSPEMGETSVDWGRDEVRVRPRRGWRPGTTYTVTLLPGMTDLRRNVSREGASIVFSTGPTIADGSIAGRLFDWVAGRPIAGRIEAWAPDDTADADTTRWVAAADSSGRFTLENLPAGRYVVRGSVDQTPNRRLDRSEMWDSVAVPLLDTARVELLAFVHDSAGPGLSGVEVRDSVTLRVTLDRPMFPELPIPPGAFTLRAADSTLVPISSVLPARIADSLAAARADTAAPRARPAEARPPAATPSRPSPPRELVVRLARPLADSTEHRLRAELRGLLGTVRASDYRFTTAAAAAPPTSPGAPASRPQSTPARPGSPAASRP
jgi:hypothetical protein